MKASQIVTIGHDREMAALRRRNALIREAEAMYAQIQRFKELCDAKVIRSVRTIAEVERIVAAVEGVAS